MSERLSSLDLSMLYAESPTTPMHVGAVAIFDPAEHGFDSRQFSDFVIERISSLPRYRQKLKSVPGRLAGPVWVDVADLDVAYHVRRCALPRPGSPEQLRELIARVQSRPLDRNRPLWELYLVEGLADGQFAVITKTHYAIVDGVSALDVSQVILTESMATAAPATAVPGSAAFGAAASGAAVSGGAGSGAVGSGAVGSGAVGSGAVSGRVPASRASGTSDESDRAAPVPGRRSAGPEPDALQLLSQAVLDGVRRPREVVELVRLRTSRLASMPRRLALALPAVASGVRTVARPAPASPLNAAIGAQRRFATVDTPLLSYQRIRQLRGGTVNDAALTVVTGAIRGWLLSRGEAVTPATVVRALVPLSAHRTDEVGFDAATIVPYLIDLPVGEPNPVVALSQVSYGMQAHVDSGQSVRADALAALSGFAPPTLHALGARAANSLAHRMFNLVVSNVPGAQHPMYAAGSMLQASYPVVPLAMGQSLAIGLTSYNGRVFYGLNGDRDIMGDIDTLAALIAESLEGLLGAAERAASGGAAERAASGGAAERAASVGPGAG